MKKTLALVCLLCASSDYAMHAARAKAVGIVAAPIIVPASYYWYKTQQVRKEIDMRAHESSNQTETDRQKSSPEIFDSFLAGAISGITPGANVAMLGACVSTLQYDLKRTSPPFSNTLERNWRVTRTGVLSGASVYVTLPIVLRWLQKMPK